MPNPAEVATLLVRGLKFTAWESVWVQHNWPENAPLFRFASTEEDKPKWLTLQFKPGDECAIYLGGQLGVVGIITARQVAYDATNHGIMLMGKGKTWLAARASVVHDTMTFDNKTFEQVAREVLKPFKYITPKVIGKLNETPFKRLRAPSGVTVWGFLEEIARTVGVVIGSDHVGNFLLIGDHDYPVDNALVEGRNILKAQIIIDRQNVYSDYIFKNGAPADDKDHMGKQGQQMAKVLSDIAMQYSPLMGVMEYPAWTQAEVQKRAQYEKQWQQGTEVTANITVQGWHQPSGKLWEAGAKYHVETPMGMLNQPLKAKTVTFTQDRNTGTQTTLELVAPYMLNDKSDLVFKDTKIEIEQYTTEERFPQKFPEEL